MIDDAVMVQFCLNPAELVLVFNSYMANVVQIFSTVSGWHGRYRGDTLHRITYIEKMATNAIPFTKIVLIKDFDKRAACNSYRNGIIACISTGFMFVVVIKAIQKIFEFVV